VSLLRRRSKPLLALLAFAVLALVVSACAVYKLNSLQISQPGGIGSVRVHFEICTNPDGETGTCTPSDNGGEWQSIAGIAVPKGSIAPATITATPLKGGPTIVFSRSDQAAQSMAEGTAALAALGEGEAWPPPETEGVAYLSAPFTEEDGVLREWSVDADFGLPAPADGGSFGGPFATSIAYGLRAVGGEAGSAERPVDCMTGPSDVTPESAYCLTAEGGQIGTSDLKIAAAPQGAAFLGGKATLSFPLDFASTATTLPSFNLSTTSTLPNAQLALASPTFTPGAPDATTRRSPLAFGTVDVTVPKNAKPGLYDVTLTAATPQGGSVSQVAKLLVTKAKLKLGKIKFNKAKGTALLFVKVPSAGTLTVSGKGVAKAKRGAKAAKTLKVPVKAKGKAKALLGEVGKAKVKAKIGFKPANGAVVTMFKSIALKQS